MSDEPKPELIGAWDRDESHEFAWEHKDDGLFVLVREREKDPDSGEIEEGTSFPKEGDTGWQVQYFNKKPSDIGASTGNPCGEVFDELSDAKELAVDFMDEYHPFEYENPIRVAREEICE